MSVSLFTLSDVAHHNSHKDGWIVVDGDVLDVTEYMSSHPGGAEEIHPYLGKDATSAFAAIEHSKYALKLLQKFKIGMIGVPVEESSEMKQLPLQHDPDTAILKGEIHGRNKEPLDPLHSPMAWLRLIQKRVRVAQREISAAELAIHNEIGDVWLALNGAVYDVSHYVDFHPGGRDEIMRGAGRDATVLFLSYHSWVNYDFLLSKYRLGDLVE